MTVACDSNSIVGLFDCGTSTRVVRNSSTAGDNVVSSSAASFSGVPVSRSSKCAIPKPVPSRRNPTKPRIKKLLVELRLGAQYAPSYTLFEISAGDVRDLATRKGNVAEHARFDLHLGDAVLQNITDADDADEPPIHFDRKMADTPVGHYSCDLCNTVIR